MPVKLLPHLRFLNQSLPLTRSSTMKPTNPSVKHYSSRVIPIFSRIFPHKLRYQSLSSKLGLPREYLGLRRFSTRGRPGLRNEVRASKSLIDDEAELSDWVSGLRSNSFQTHDDDSGTGSGRDRGRGSDRVRGRGREERSGRDGVRFSSFKRQKEGYSDDYSKGRDSFSREKTRFGGKFEGKDEGFVSRRRENVWQGESNSTMSRRGGQASEFGYGRDRGAGGGGGRGNSRGSGGLNRGGKSMQRGGFVTSDEEIGDDSEGEGERRLAKIGGRGSGSSYGWDRGGRGSRSNGSSGLKGSGRSLRKGSLVTSDEEIGEDDDDYDEGEGKLAKRGVRGSDSDSMYGQDRGGQGGRSNISGGLNGNRKSLRKGSLVTSDEEIVNDDDEGGDVGLMKSFSDLISEEEDGDGDDDDDDLLKNAGSLFPGKKGVSTQAVPSSPGRTDSYLSETRGLSIG